jgi:hypothetical protein
MARDSVILVGEMKATDGALIHLQPSVGGQSMVKCVMAARPDGWWQLGRAGGGRTLLGGPTVLQGCVRPEGNQVGAGE